MGYNRGINTKIISLAKLSLLSKAIAHSICMIVGQPACYRVLYSWVSVLLIAESAESQRGVWADVYSV